MSALDPAHRRDELERLVREGLSRDNLDKISEHCESLSQESPTVFFAIGTISQTLSQEFGHAMEGGRYDEILQAIQDPLIGLLAEEKRGGGPATLQKLDTLVRAYEAVYTPPR